ncbi:MAG: REP-associated tyrosine transposase [Alphaproteobacteria bacterium]
MTFRLADSLPRSISVPARHGAGPSAERRCIIEDALDAGHGSCALGNPVIARLVEAALLHFDGSRYRLLAWTVMPNHVHALIQTVPGHALCAVVQSWKSFTAKQVRRIAPGPSRFWQPEYFDRYVRNDRHLAAVMTYIEANPVKAGLCAAPEDWPFGSACRRREARSAGVSPADARW